ncbi:hypothetical protein JIN85_02295 [Luteolibacter pohnpeiensis]|uniref:Uncharacterized protein n=1 Tax=Luteolibacter pohnpeiensis TaxID=454153 RepID=A0A934VUK4_9BACT|nr:hypothetical protein [Luteolibacter pohnpeiensis]MBK1881225.1 hypothetical protein [Luteolibacter pohnpeiensis]
MQLCFRLLAFLVVLALIGWGYLVMRIDGRPFQKEVEDSIERSLGAKDLETNGFKRTEGQLNLVNLEMKGSKAAFFDSLKVTSMKCEMSLLDGFTGAWDTGLITAASANLEMRAGADDDAAAQQIGEALFKTYGRVKVSALQINDFNMGWGFSDQTKGSIHGAEARIQRVAEGWKVDLKGGTFSQNWIRGLKIIHLAATCTPEGITFDDARFGDDTANLDLTGLHITGGSRPTLSGTAVMTSVPMSALIPVAAQRFMDGTISGSFKVSGSLNTPSGVNLEGTATISDSDRLVFRDSLPLLRSLSVVDAYHNYRRVEFKSGSFKLKTGGAKMELSQVKLNGGDLMTVSGSLEARTPTPEEVRELIAQGADQSSAQFDLFVEDPSDDVGSGSGKYAEPSKDDDQGASPAGQDLTRLQQEAAERVASSMRYKGEFEISLNANAFDRAEMLAAKYPVDPETGRVVVKVPIDAGIGNITLKMASEIYKGGKR